MKTDSGVALRKQLAEEFDKHHTSGIAAKDKKQLARLLELYYAHVSHTDLETENLSDLVGAVIAHWQLLKTRKDKETRVRVYNPNFEEHGWQSQHTIIEVASEDMAFLVDSLAMGLNRAGVTSFLSVHPVIRVEYDKQGKIRSVHDISENKGRPISLVRFEVEKQVDEDTLQAIEAMVQEVIQDVTCANTDWPAMKQQLQLVIARGQESKLPVCTEELEETQAFLNWIDDNHFTFLGYCIFDLKKSAGKETLELDKSSTLGLFRQADGVGHRAESVVPIPSENYSNFACYLVVTKSNARSSVHRPAYMDFLGIKRFNARGEVDGMICFLGLFTSAAYSSAPKHIPLLRKKVSEVLERAGLASNSHSGKALANILNNFPRDSLFQVSDDELTDISLGILGLQERQLTRVFLHKDAFQRFYSCLVYLPRERYNRELRIRIQKVLIKELDGVEVEFTASFSESVLARLHYIVYVSPGHKGQIDQKALEQKIVDASQTWEDGLRVALSERYGEVRAGQYIRRFGNAFPYGYREDFAPRTAAADVVRIEEARESGQLGIHIYRPILDEENRLHVRLYSAGKQVSLSDAIPILEHMGLSVFGERPYRVKLSKGNIWIHDFSTNASGVVGDLTGETGALFREAFTRIWNGEADNDGFNQLVLSAGLSWKQVFMLRAYARYMKQIKIPFSQSYIVDSLTRYPQIARMLVDLFDCAFNPQRERDGEALGAMHDALLKQLDQVLSLDHDRILRAYLNLIESTLRTNFYQCDGEGAQKCYLSFKVDPRKVNGMPLPMPMFEIFVFSAHMEGVHLRGGKVARGGLRWSDRMEDYRTEVLGLMKAQMVKNTVIVPVGSKGGFVVKHMPESDDREVVMAEVIHCYKTLLRGMLDITDNLVNNEIVPPVDVVRLDEDDPYLVVAADKGTATFSDIANSVSEEYGFWLGDAFASGGSAGYDHKGMGITARGAWESVKRNFRELGVDIQSTDFRVIGIGDMAGDVFGNGMLLSRHIKLVGAFNHMHIFLDPDPDPEKSFKERERLFTTPRTTWADYSKKLISKGGGIFSRSDKSIPLSEPVREMLGVKQESMTPSELIHHMLKAPVDLVWNGGIGTYVKASSETHEQVGDKANESLRVDGRELRCKVFGEGGNLGVTQLGRIEFSRKGGRIYTDAVDNSAGVDCSDHEVNIKILLGQILSNGDMTLKQRNTLLAEMTDEVADLVLANNYSQTQAISMVAANSEQLLYEHARFIDYLEHTGRLNRALEFLPDAEEIARRQAANEGLTKPELSVLLAYSKMTYYDALIHSDIPDDDYLLVELDDYFPKVLGERYHSEMLTHRLKREIISTHLTNDIVDHIGPGFGYRVREEVGANIAGVTRAYISASKIYSTNSLWRRIEELDNKVAASVQIEMMGMIAAMLEQTVKWILRTRRNAVVIRDLVDYFQDGVAELAQSLPKPLSSKERLDLTRRVKYLVGVGVPRELAQIIAAMGPLSSALDIVDVARQAGQPVAPVGELYFHLGDILDFRWIREQIMALGVQNHWHNLAKTRLVDMLNSHQRELTAQILASAGNGRLGRKLLDGWIEENRFSYDRHSQMLGELKAKSSTDFAMLSVVVNGLAGLYRVEQ